MGWSGDTPIRTRDSRLTISPFCHGLIGPGVEIAQPEACGALGEASRAISGAVVGHHTRDVDAKLAEVGDDGSEEVRDTCAGLIGIDLGEADSGVVVDADMHVVPAGSSRTRAPVPGDAVARLLETRECLDVQLQQLTGMLALVAPDRWGRFRGVESVEPGPAQDPTDGGGRDHHGPCHLDPRLALEPQRRDAGDVANRSGPGLSMRPRTTVGQAVGTLGLIPGDLLAHGAPTDARGGGTEVHWQLVVEHAGDQFGSTRGGGSGILMDVHSVLQMKPSLCAPSVSAVRVESSTC